MLPYCGVRNFIFKSLTRVHVLSCDKGAGRSGVFKLSLPAQITLLEMAFLSMFKFVWNELKKVRQLFALIPLEILCRHKSFSAAVENTPDVDYRCIGIHDVLKASLLMLAQLSMLKVTLDGCERVGKIFLSQAVLDV